MCFVQQPNTITRSGPPGRCGAQFASAGRKARSDRHGGGGGGRGLTSRHGGAYAAWNPFGGACRGVNLDREEELRVGFDGGASAVLNTGKKPKRKATFRKRKKRNSGILPAFFVVDLQLFGVGTQTV